MRKFLLLIFLSLCINNNIFSYDNGEENKNPNSKKLNQRLFVIERNMNKNTVCYDANIMQNGKLDIENPIDVYWIDYAVDGKRSELNYIQRKMAYGFSFEKTNAGNIYVTLKAFDKRKILVIIDANGNPNALLKINGSDAKLNRIFVNAKPKMYTTVEYIELFGTDIKTGKSSYEKITNL